MYSFIISRILAHRFFFVLYKYQLNEVTIGAVYVGIIVRIVVDRKLMGLKDVANELVFSLRRAERCIYCIGNFCMKQK